LELSQFKKEKCEKLGLEYEDPMDLVLKSASNELG